MGEKVYAVSQEIETKAYRKPWAATGRLIAAALLLFLAGVGLLLLLPGPDQET